MRVLVVSAHPDDETLGCGGTLLNHGNALDTLSWCVVTSAWPELYGPAVWQEKLAERQRVHDAYGFEAFYPLDLPCTRLDQMPQGDLIGLLTSAVADARPDVIYTVGDSDFHTDHVITFECLMVALKPFKWRRPLAVYAYEIPSSTEGGTWRGRPFEPTRFVDISTTLERKLDILDLYTSERQEWPLPRSRKAVEHLARWRGASMGMEAAEAFRVVRETVW